MHLKFSPSSIQIISIITDADKLAASVAVCSGLMILQISLSLDQGFYHGKTSSHDCKCLTRMWLEMQFMAYNNFYIMIDDHR